jgi:hypothetical protein
MNATEIQTRLTDDTPFYSRHLLKIADKTGKIVPLDYSPAQLALDKAMESQRTAGKAVRVIILKARQIGFTTGVQSKLIQRTTTRPNYNVVVVAHDRDTGAKIYRIGKRMYDNLPDDPAFKPDLAGTRRGRELHFVNGGTKAARDSGGFPDSIYLVDTAGEFNAGRGGTYQAVHASEAAFWDDLLTKLTALKNAVPNHPESMFIIESTANGNNAFKQLWDDAEAGVNEYIPFFWPWWKEAQYSLPFDNNEAREEFRIGDVSQSRFAEGEPKLYSPGPIDTMTGEPIPLTLEQLHWRRRTIANECSGSFEMFNQEYPATPAEAFVASARQAFDPDLIQGVQITARVSDPPNPTPEMPGPWKGKLLPAESVTKPTPAGGTLSVPTKPKFVIRSELEQGEQSDWKFFVDPSAPFTEQAIIGVDVSGGETEVEGSEPAFHAIEVIDHKTRVQLAEYSSRIDPDLLAEQIYLAALHFNMPWVAIEVTGSWGLTPANKMWHQGYRYPFLYFRKSVDKKMEKQSNRLGWDTNRQTRPLLMDTATGLLREGNHGVRSFDLASEWATMVRMPNGRVEPERGKYSDRFMAWAIAQHVAEIQPIKGTFKTKVAPRGPRQPGTNW